MLFEPYRLTIAPAMRKRRMKAGYSGGVDGSTTVTNKKICQRRPAEKARGQGEDDTSDTTARHWNCKNLLQALRAMRAGDFSVRMGGEQDGLLGKIADTFNDIVASNQRMAQQLERVGQVVGREGKTRHRVKFGVSNGAWGEMEFSVNTLIDDLIWPTKEVTTAIAAVAQGNLLKTVRTEVDGRPLKGEFLEAATIVNTMIKQLSVFTSEVTRVAREVGTEGKLGGQAQVREVTGVWKDLTESVNSMASNLTAQVRNIAGSHHRRRRRRPFQENHRRRARRNSSAEGSHQYDGGPAAIVRFRSDARRARGRHRRQSSAARLSCRASPEPGRT